MRRHLTVPLFSLAALALPACAAESNEPIDLSGETGGSGGSIAGAGGGNAAGAGAGGGATGGTGGTGTGGSGGGVAMAGQPASGGTGTGGSTGGTGTGGSTGGTGGSAAGSPPVGKATISLPYLDDFEDGDAADWFADKATDDSVGDWAVVDDGESLSYQARTAFEDESWTVGGDRNWTDVRIEARVKFLSEYSGAEGDSLIYVAGRWAPGDRDYYFAEFPIAGKPKVRRKVDGSSDDVLTFDDLDEVPVPLDTWHTIALTLSGADVTLEIDGTVLGTITDGAPLAAGGIALGTRDCAAAFDDVSVTAP